MSAKLARRVFASSLPPDLKAVAALMALYGNSEGESIFPAIARVALECGCSIRTAQYRVKRLRQMEILVPVGSTKGGIAPGGRGRTVRYRLDVDALLAFKGATITAPLHDIQGCSGASVKGAIAAAPDLKKRSTKEKRASRDQDFQPSPDRGEVRSGAADARLATGDECPSGGDPDVWAQCPEWTRGDYRQWVLRVGPQYVAQMRAQRLARQAAAGAAGTGAG